MRTLLRLITSLAMTTALLFGFTGLAQAVSLPRSGQLTIGEISFDSGNGIVYCKYSAGSSYGVGDNTHGTPYYDYNVSVSKALDGPSHISGCRRNGVDVNGTGANQWYIIGAWQFIDPSNGNVDFTTFPAQAPYSNETTATSAYSKFTIRTLVAVCAGGGGSCTFPVIVSTLAYQAP